MAGLQRWPNKNLDGRELISVSWNLHQTVAFWKPCCAGWGSAPLLGAQLSDGQAGCLGFLCNQKDEKGRAGGGFRPVKGWWDEALSRGTLLWWWLGNHSWTDKIRCLTFRCLNLSETNSTCSHLNSVESFSLACFFYLFLWLAFWLSLRHIGKGSFCLFWSVYGKYNQW